MRKYFKQIAPLVRKKIKLALLISLIGGIPGIINVWNWSHQHPEFVFHAEDVADGSATYGGLTKFRFFMVAGAIYNSGNVPLFPVGFELKATYEDTVIIVGAVPIFDTSFVAEGMDKGSLDMNFGNPSQKDLLNIVRVSPLDASFGILFFPFPYTTFNDLGNFKSLQITCFDILNKKRTFNIELALLNDHSPHYFSKKTGINVR